MSRVVLILLLAGGAYFFYSQKSITFMDGAHEHSLITPAAVKDEVEHHMATRFICDGRQYCSEMTSREEAEFFLLHCPDTRMDGDHDGIPCENDSRW
ncbi:excalibur calcium-binding domain-containing protein [Marinobacter hydrocarbonoclasticus]|nr:excalibur calcium-binding domain-containing protein [Marinobacter nauticus]